MYKIDAEWISERMPRRRGAKSALAAAMGVRPEIVTRILNGSRKVQPDEIPAILDFFGVDPASVLGYLPSSPAGRDVSPALLRLLDRLSQLEDEELDYLSVAAEGLAARRRQAEGQE